LSVLQSAKPKMMMSNASVDEPEVYIGVICFNGKDIIEKCISSILEQTYSNFHVHLIDNASTDGTPELVAERFPKVEIIRHAENNGPNPARNLALRKANCSLVFLVDDDITLTRNCLSELVEAYKKHPDAVVWHPRIFYSDEINKIQYEGGLIHYLNEGILLNTDLPAEQGIQDISPIQTAFAAFLIRKEVAEHIGYFDEDLFFGGTDSNFTFRLSQAGYRLYAVPFATCYHKVKKRGLQNVYYRARNRWYMILTCYAFRTMIVILPALIVYEITLILFLAFKGRIGDYQRAIVAVVRHFPGLMEKRKQIQAVRKVKDKYILHAGSFYMRGDVLDNRLAACAKSALNGFFDLYWRLVYPLV
jgi:GT2 family glycosyltransferase